MSNDASNESEKVLESLFEPDNAEILLELKNGSKPLSVLMEKIDISEVDLDEKLSYLIEKGFVKKEESTKVLENDENFKNIDDGLAKLDSFLN